MRPCRASRAHPLPAWTRRTLRALLLVLLLVPALMGPPYRNLGRADETGNRYYRAYFTADFVWHSALASSSASSRCRRETPTWRRGR